MPAAPSPPQHLSGDAASAGAWLGSCAAHWRQTTVLLLLAGTDTAAVPESRRWTAAADAELLLLGPAAERRHALPPLPAGVSPALIAHEVVSALGLDPLGPLP